MSVRLDEGTDLGEDQKKNIQALDSPESIFFFFCIDQDYFFFFQLLSVPIKGMDEMFVRLDDGTDLGEDQKKNIQALDSPESIFFFFFFFLTRLPFFFYQLLSVPIKGMDEMYVRLDDKMDFGEAFFLLATVRPD